MRCLYLNFRLFGLALTASSMSLAGFACNDSAISPVSSPAVMPSSNPVPPGNQPGSTVTWNSLTEKTACEAMNPDSCQGAYGFKVNSDGSYVVGPAGDGQSLMGTLTGDELALLAREGGAAVSAEGAAAETCDAAHGVPGTQDRVEIMRSDQSSVEIYSLFTANGSNCYRGDRAAAMQLHTDLNSLMMKYYPRPFPSSTEVVGTPVTQGVWGGRGARLTVQSDSTLIKLDCAHSVLQGPLTLNSQNQFEATGMLTLEGGPISPNDPRQRPARLSGTVNGNSMHLTVTYTTPDNHEFTSNYSLDLGGESHFTVCAL